MSLPKTDWEMLRDFSAQIMPVLIRKADKDDLLFRLEETSGLLAMQSVALADALVAELMLWKEKEDEKA